MNTQERLDKVLHDLQGTVEVPGPLGELGLVIEDVAVTPAGKRRLVRIWLDRDLAGLAPEDESSPVEPLSLDEVAEATRAISAGLDASDALGETPYVLEVGSAGVERPLTAPRHFRRNVTRLVEISCVAGAPGTAAAAGSPEDKVGTTDYPSSPITGRLVAAGSSAATLLVAATKKEPEAELRILYADIARAQVQVEFARVTTEEES